MKIICKGCNTPIPLRVELLQKYAGKLVSIKCPSCGNIVKFKARAANPDIKIHDPSAEDTVIGSNTPKAVNTNIIGMLKIVSNEYATSQTFSIPSGKSIIGRLSQAVNAAKPNIGVITNDTYMSKLHCMIEMEEQKDGNYKYILSNYQGKNGTFLGDTKLNASDAFYLNDGDSFKIGRTTILFHIEKK